VSGEVDVEWAEFEAVLFDLDGVLTDTASIHFTCWQRTFDEFLQARAQGAGDPVAPFGKPDYLAYVDGKRRYDGVRDFLLSRGIQLPVGDPNDAPDRETVCGVGNRKNVLVNEALATQPIDVYEASAALVRDLRAAGVKTAVVSSSANCATILRAAGLETLFDVRVDGAVAAERGLPGKPAPDTFLEAARELGVEPARAVVVEDAISGVQAGRRGAFGLVVGIARHDEPERLLQEGADVVVTDLAEIPF